MTAPLLDVDRLSVSFRMRTGTTHILRDVSLQIRPGERVAVVGESGSGKSVLARAVMGLLPERTAQVDGAIRFDGSELLGQGTRHLAALRGRDMAMILQDPTSSLNPTFTIEDQFYTVLTRHPDRPDRKIGRGMMAAALEEVLIVDVDRVLDSYPSQLSGGMNQRVMIAMALINRPKLLIADEPGASLDVTVQAQTLRKMLELSDKYGTAILFISHNLGVVRGFASSVGVLYAGAVMEEGPSRSLFERPRHPYTRCLIDAIPRLAHPVMPKGIEGHLPDLHVPPPGCVFASRCPEAMAACASYDRVPVQSAPGHRSFCLRST